MGENGAVTSDVHTCVAKWLISWEGTFLSKVNHKIVVKLNTGCVQNVVTTWRCELGRPRLGTDAEDDFPGTSYTYPHGLVSIALHEYVQTKNSTR